MELVENNIDVYKIMALEVPRKIKSLFLDIFMPSGLYSHKFKVLQSTTEECTVKINIEESVAIELKWHLENS